MKAWLDRDAIHGVTFNDLGDTLSKIACYDVLFLKICRAVPSKVLVRERDLFGVAILHHAVMETFQSFSTSSVREDLVYSAQCSPSSMFRHVLGCSQALCENPMQRTVF